MPKTALITGISGQDGSFLAQQLLQKGYEVHGLIRRTSQTDIGCLKELSQSERDALKIHFGDITDNSFIERLLQTKTFDEIYHLAAQSHVGTSFKKPEETYYTNIPSVLNILNGIHVYAPNARFYFAGSSEMFGKTEDALQSEKTPFFPQSPYAVSKVAGFWVTRHAREQNGIFACSGILFNHESERRGLEFVTRKITHAVAQIVHKKQTILELGNLDVRRDWGYAPEYVDAMHRMLQTEKPEDFVIASGETHSVREFCEQAFAYAGHPIFWSGSDIQEVGKCKKTKKTLIKINPKFYRPTEVRVLCGNAQKAKEKLSWNKKTSFKNLVEKMVTYDLNLSASL